jgi:signal transduction histidine kinase
MHDPVIGLDENMRVIFANSEANKVLALEDSLLLGQQSKDIALRNDLMRELIKDLEETNEAGKIQKPIKIFAGGKQSYFEKDIQHITIVPTGESEPRLIGHVIRLHNVTEYKELDSAKTHFISNLSHEFKTPISSIKMGVQLLENEKMGILNSRQREVLNSITEDANRLLKSTFDLLNINQVESGNLKLVKVKVNIAEVLEKAVLANKSLADEKRIEIKITGEPYPEFLEIDVEKTIWVFSNLISNALRYSPEDSEIYIDLTSSEDQLCIAFRDFGPGIPPEYQTRIFDRYFRVPNNTKEGTGLGLAISREFMEAQGGGISVKSQMGQGSTFFVTFPLDRN